MKREDKDALNKAKGAIEEALREFGGNYTQKEREELTKKLERINAALEAIGNAKRAADEIEKLPDADEIKPGDKDKVDRVKDIIAALTENERAMLGKDAIDKVSKLEQRLKELAAGGDDSPKTEDAGEPMLWIALLIISGIIAGITIIVKKKKRC